MIARQISDYLVDGVIMNAVNFPSVALEMMEALRPYLDLGERMGSFIGQLVRHLHDVTITYSGEVTKLDTRPLTGSGAPASGATHTPFADLAALLKKD